MTEQERQQHVKRCLDNIQRAKLEIDKNRNHLAALGYRGLS